MSILNFGARRPPLASTSANEVSSHDVSIDKIFTVIFEIVRGLLCHFSPRYLAKRDFTGSQLVSMARIFMCVLESYGTIENLANKNAPSEGALIK